MQTIIMKIGFAATLAIQCFWIGTATAEQQMTSPSKRVYLANPLGFSTQQRQVLLPQIIEKLESMGLEVIEPFAHAQEIIAAQEDWAYEVGQWDVEQVRACDAIFAVLNGTPPDEGVMIELGVAIALNKKIFLFRDDFRRCCDSDKYPLNLMVFTGLPDDAWEEYYYTCLEDITDGQRPLAHWANS